MFGSVNQSCYNCFRWGPKTQLTFRAHRLLYDKVGHSTVLSFLNWRNILSWIPFGSDLDPNRVCKWRKRERDWCRHVKVNIASADQQVERERERCVCVLFEFRQFFLLWGLVYVFQSFVSIFAKTSDRTRCLAVSILEYNLGPNITGVRGTILTGIRSRQSERKRFDFWSSDSSVVRDEWT